MVQEIINEEDSEDEQQIHINAEKFNNATFKFCGYSEDDEHEIVIPDGYYYPHDFVRTFNDLVRNLPVCTDVDNLLFELYYFDETNQFVLRSDNIHVLEYTLSTGVMLGFDKPTRYSTNCWTSPTELYLGISLHKSIFDLDSLMN